MKYLIYLRVSTKEQDERTQLDHCLRFIKQKGDKDFEYEVFTDIKTSKKPLFKREGGQKLIETMKKGDIIIAMRLDRIARNLSETTKLIDELDAKGVEILLVEQPGISNKIMLGLYAGMAEEEVKLLRKRVKEKLDSKKNRGERYSRYLPYGYGLHETKLVAIKSGDKIVMKRGILVPIYEEQKILERMIQLSTQGLSHSRIAKILATEGYLNREGKPFQKMSIYRILARKDQAKFEEKLLEESVPL